MQPYVAHMQQDVPAPVRRLNGEKHGSSRSATAVPSSWARNPLPFPFHVHVTVPRQSIAPPPTCIPPSVASTSHVAALCDTAVTPWITSEWGESTWGPRGGQVRAKM